MKRAVLLALLLAAPGTAAAVTPGEVDDFGTTTEGWQRGVRVAQGQPGGDGYSLQLSSDGVADNGRLVTFNQAQWAGDYAAERVRSLVLLVNNVGPTELSLRLAFGDTSAPMAGGSWYVSASPVVVPSGSGWMLVTLSTECSSLAQTQGAMSCAQLLSAVTTLRLLHAVTIDDQGTPVSALLYIDRISATREVPLLPTGD